MTRSFLLERQGRSLLFIQPLWLARRWQGALHTFSHPVSQNPCVLMPILQMWKIEAWGSAMACLRPHD